ITVSAKADGSSPRTYTVYPANGENRLRQANWAEENRRLVDKLSGGRVGYIFIDGYGPDGIMNAIRGLTGYADKQGVIVDQRFNGGGITPDYLIEWMERRPLYYYMFREGSDIATPVNPAPPVKVMIINELNGSAAETGAFMFKLGKVGPIVGKRTFGAGIGPYYFTPRLIDGGSVQLPNRAAYDPSGTSWGIENVGVVPDYDVEIMPQDVIAHRDPQLEKAVEVALAQIAKTPATQPRRPKFPIHPGDVDAALAATPLTIPLPGSAYPAPTPKPTQTAAVPTDSRFAAYAGSYDAGSMGVMVVRQQGDKLVAVAPNSEEVELSPQSTADTFIALPPQAIVRFERDPAGKISGIVITMPNGREIRGKRTQ
ncbi:MAG TPA: S41 family peptidase, partial [Pyrinomonadaceae bacterium]|nr:S41 family peptidase [Pyrinomonadaceae bacterium]